MLANARMTPALQSHRQRAADGSLQNNQSYYSDALTLFGLGWLEQRYRFNRWGLLSVRWTLRIRSTALALISCLPGFVTCNCRAAE